MKNMIGALMSDRTKRKHILSDKILLINSIIIALGIMLGAILYIFNIEVFEEKIFESFLSFNVDFTSKTKTEILSGLIISHLPYIFFMILFGTSAVGVYFIAPLTLIKACGLGLIVAYIYSYFGLKGLEYAIIVFLPDKFFVIFSMLLIMYASVSNSIIIRKFTKGEYQKNYSSSLFFLNVITAVSIFILSSFIEYFLIVSFSSLFEFC